MTHRVQKHRDFLSVITRCSPHLRKAILSQASPELVKTITECLYNGLKRKDVKHKKKLSGILHRLVRRRTSLNTKRKTLVQAGGFLPLILGPILASVLGGIAGKLIGKAIP